MRKSTFLSKAFFSVCILLSSTSYLQAQELSGNDPVSTAGNVYRVIDGDTFVVNIEPDAYARIKSQSAGNSDRERYLNDDFNSIRIRLANVDTPESVHQDESRNTVQGSNISNHIKDMLEGQDVGVMCHDFGNYGRVICNVRFEYNEGNIVDLGAYLIANGLSPYVTHFGNSPYYHNEYIKLELEANSR